MNATMTPKTDLEKLIENVSVKQMMAIYQTDTLADATAMLATLYSSAKQSYRLHVTENLGCTSEDIDLAMQKLDEIFLMNPQML